MNNLPRILMLSAAGVLTMAFAPRDHETQKAAAAVSLAGSATVTDQKLQARGLESSAWGDDWTATNLFERSAEKRPGVLELFNLAAAYQRTGRMDKAAPLYRTVAVHGGYTWVRPSSDFTTRPGERIRPILRFNLADESVARLERIEGPTMVADATPANGAWATSAAAEGVNASATVGAVLATPRVSDESARKLDQAQEYAAKN